MAKTDLGPSEQEVAEAIAFRQATQRIRFLVQSDAVHKRGFRLSEVTDMSLLIHMLEEVTEVMREEDQIQVLEQQPPALTIQQDILEPPQPTLQERRTRAMDKLGDVLGCWLHYIIRKGYPLEELLQRYSKSLTEDFPGAFPTDPTN